MSKDSVLDSFALLCLFKEEPGWKQVEEILREAREGKCRVYLSLINWGEFYYAIRRIYGHVVAQEKLDLLAQLPVEIVSVDESLVRQASEIKSENKISYADAFCAATAKLKNAVVLTGDSEFKALEKFIPIRWLR